jgi:hypothetical protein
MGEEEAVQTPIVGEDKENIQQLLPVVMQIRAEPNELPALRHNRNKKKENRTRVKESMSEGVVVAYW